MGKTITAALIAGTGLGASAVAEEAADRAGSVINAFQVMCTLQRPDFARIEAQATAMRMKQVSDQSAPSGNGTMTRSKVWAGGLTTGPFVLLLDEMSGSRGTSTSCAVAAEVPDSDALRTKAIGTMRLPTPSAPEVRGDGSRSFVWDRQYGPGTTLIVRDYKPSGKPGVMLKLLAMDRKG